MLDGTSLDLLGQWGELAHDQQVRTISAILGAVARSQGLSTLSVTREEIASTLADYTITHELNPAGAWTVYLTPKIA